MKAFNSLMCWKENTENEMSNFKQLVSIAAFHLKAPSVGFEWFSTRAHFLHRIEFLNNEEVKLSFYAYAKSKIILLFMKIFQWGKY